MNEPNETGGKTAQSCRHIVVFCRLLIVSKGVLMKRKRILVTGGAGFIGSHLCEYFLENGNEVLCIDNFVTGQVANIAEHLNNPLFKLIRHDVCMPLFYDIDEIYNLACPASPVQYQIDPIYTLKTNVLGAMNALNLAKRTKAKIFQASTSEIYGEPHFHPQPEEYWGNVNPIGIRACYDEGKRCAETLFFDFRRMYSVKTRVARLFNTYGPRMAEYDGRVVGTFILQALRNEPIPIFGTGMQTRSFCFVSDTVDAITRFMDCEDDVAGPLNLGNPAEITILELAEKIIKMTCSQSKLVFKPLPKDDPCRRKPDITKASKILGWEPKVKLEEGLLKTINYFEGLLSRETKITVPMSTAAVYNTLTASI